MCAFVCMCVRPCGRAATLRVVQAEMLTAVTTALQRLRKRMAAHLAALHAATQAQRASEANKVVQLEETVSGLRLQVASLQTAVSAAEDSLAKERASNATLRQRVTALTTEVEVAKASQHSTAADASASSAQVAELTRRLGDASEEVPRRPAPLPSPSRRRVTSVVRACACSSRK